VEPIILIFKTFVPEKLAKNKNISDFERGCQFDVLARASSSDSGFESVHFGLEKITKRAIFTGQAATPQKLPFVV
jgi:hypothetical protein